MPPRVKILSESLANKIAAGEVVERPASVVKELVENALDAGATDIRLEIVNGGRRLIRVSDNGHGMSREDSLLALERHATSKLASDSDLDHITTLGFRGEALPAIASVSRLRLRSRQVENIEGTEIEIDGGRVKQVAACGMAPGTDITVEQLFFNTPARLKFLRSTETEAAHVGDLIVRLAISRPDVSFCYLNEGREVFRVAAGELLQRLQRLMARDAQLYPFEGETDAALVSGYLAAPNSSRSTSNAIFTFINGRFVRDKVVQHAILQAWRPVLERGRYPLLALFLELPVDEVDVNVHPTKHEVRFRRQGQVHDTIQSVLSAALSRSPWLQRPSSHAVPSPPAPTPRQETTHQPHQAAVQQALDRFMAAPARPATITTVNEASAPRYAAVAEHDEPGGYFSSLQVIGQFQAAYILCQSSSELVIIDQHAAYERVRFEQLKTSFLAGGIESQRLLLAETLELSFTEAAAARRHQQGLQALGFELEAFGGQTFRLNAVPRMVDAAEQVRLVRDLLAELATLGTSGSFEQVRDDLLSRVACHSVVRGAYPLDRRQMEELLREMDRTDFSAHCPHGRPVSHSIGLRELEKLFKRT